jgi:hypothetical protein
VRRLQLGHQVKPAANSSNRLRNHPESSPEPGNSTARSTGSTAAGDRRCARNGG